MKHKAGHESLAKFKHDVFSNYVSMPLHAFEQRLGARSYPCVQFATRTNVNFSIWHSRFYRERRKIVPLELAMYLSPLSIAVWFMDDGAADYAGVTFQNHSFLKQEVVFLGDVLDKKFRLAATPRRNKGAWLLYVNAASLPLLHELVEPHLLQAFRYKLQPRRTRTP